MRLFIGQNGDFTEETLTAFYSQNQVGSLDTLYCMKSSEAIYILAQFDIGPDELHRNMRYNWINLSNGNRYCENFLDKDIVTILIKLAKARRLYFAKGQHELCKLITSLT